MTNLVKAMDKNDKKNLYLKSVFNKYSSAKLNEGLFVGLKNLCEKNNVNAFTKDFFNG